MNTEQRKRTDDFCYIAGIAILILGIVGACILHKLKFSMDSVRGFCMLHYLTGFYCPGCGGTRAIQALFHGELLQSFLFHPVVIPSLLLYLFFMLTQTIERLTKGKLKTGMHFRDAYLWFILFFCIFQCVIKNILVLYYHTDVLRWIA